MWAPLYMRMPLSSLLLRCGAAADCASPAFGGSTALQYSEEAQFQCVLRKPQGHKAVVLRAWMALLV